MMLGNVTGAGATTNVSAEAVIASTPGNLPADGSDGGLGWRINGVISAPNVAATGTVTVRVRQNTIGGTVVATFGPYTVGTAAVGAVVPYDCVDNAGAPSSPGGNTSPAAYVVTLQVGVVANSGAGVTGTIGVSAATSQA